MSTTIRLKDIATEAKVSTMTVSRALRLDPRVTPSLRERIQSIAARLGYRPNPLVSALMSYRRAGKPAHYDLKLGFITAFPTRSGWKEFRLYREFYDGATIGADRHGYRIEEFWLAEPGMSPQRLAQVLQTRSIPGVLIAPLPGSQGSLSMDLKNLAAVVFGYSITDPPLHRVSNNQFRSMRLLLHELANLGYSQPGLALSESMDDRVLHQWLGAFLVSHRFAGPTPVFMPPDQGWTQAGFERWVDARRPDVVIGHSEEVLGWLRGCGRRVPDDIGFAHLDCPSAAGPISGVYQNGREVGIAGADLLVDMLHRNERGVPLLPRSSLVEGSWVNGATTRRKSRAQQAAGAPAAEVTDLRAR